MRSGSGARHDTRPENVTSVKVEETMEFHRMLYPIAGSNLASFLVGLLPVATVLILMGVVRRPAWQAAGAGLIVGLLVAILGWGMPYQVALSATGYGFFFAIFPVMYIVFTAMWLYNIAVQTGKFDLFRRWMVHNVPADRRILLLVIAFSFGALLEGIAGFGTPVAICSALLISLGFAPLEAVVLTLIFNTSPVAFGALGAPVATLTQVVNGALGTHTAPIVFSQMIGRQLPLFALFLPFAGVILLSGFKGLRTTWPIALVAGLSFALTQFAVSNFVGPELPDVLAALVSLICTVAFVQVYKPSDTEQYRAHFMDSAVAPSGTMGSPGGPVPAGALAATRASEQPGGPAMAVAGGATATTTEADLRPNATQTIQAWLPWLLVSAVVIAWIFLKFNLQEQQIIKWPMLNGEIFNPGSAKPLTITQTFQPLGTGTAILVSVVLSSLALLATPAQIGRALARTWTQLAFPILTVVLIIGLANVFNFSGIANTEGNYLAQVGGIFPFVGAFIGWLACFLSGSDTSSNALFGPLQAITAKNIGISPILMAGTNSSAAVMSKMISPQNVTTGVATTELRGQEGKVVARTFWPSVILAALMGILALLQAYVFPGVIPH